MEVLKELESIDSDELLSFYSSIENSIKWHVVEGKSRQSSLQFDTNGIEYLAGCGKTNGNDFAFNKISEIYKNTVLENLITNFKLVRTRWMWIEPYSCYSMHHDVYPRIHIPLITNSSCYFLFPTNKDTLIHLSTGKIYWLNTLLKHTFINCSDKPRLHLVGSILS